MRVFVTGASGFIGSAIVQELLGAGHSVLGLARSDASAAAIERAGAQVHRGALEDVESLVRGAEAADAVVHTAFIHDFSRFEENVRTDLRAVQGMARALEGSGKAFVISSGILVAELARTVVETDAANPAPPAGHRAAAENATLDAATRGVRAMVMRLPPTVHGPGDHGFVPSLIGMARERGFAAYVGDGAARWPAVHRLDAARLYRLAVEGGPAGARLHAVAESGIAFREIAAAIGQGLGVPVKSVTGAEAAAHFGWMARFVGRDAHAPSDWTRKTLDWQPREKQLLEDMRTSGYFAG